MTKTLTTLAAAVALTAAAIAALAPAEARGRGGAIIGGATCSYGYYGGGYYAGWPVLRGRSLRLTP